MQDVIFEKPAAVEVLFLVEVVERKSTRPNPSISKLAKIIIIRLIKVKNP